MTLTRTILVSLMLIATMSVQAVPDEIPPRRVADTVNIGAYVESLYDFDLQSNTVRADIYYWCHYDKTDLDFSNDFELKKSSAVTFLNSGIDTLANCYRFNTKASARVRQNYNLTNYPLDAQRLVISVEAYASDVDKLVFRPDASDCGLDPSVYESLDEWTVTNTQFLGGVTKYNSDFGDDVRDSRSGFSRFDIVIDLRRKDSIHILIKLITGILVAFVISCCSFFVRANNTDPRFGLSVGALFAAIGNKYIVESNVPSTSEVSMLDNLHNLTFVYIFLIIVAAVVSLHLYEKGSEEDKRKSRRLDMYAFVAVFISYLAIMGYLIGREM
jgi:hypothetical protein